MHACHSIPTRVFQTDALQPLSLTTHLHDQSLDIVFADVPYGHCSQWEGAALLQTPFPIAGLLESLRAIINPQTVVAIASTKHERIAGDGYIRLARRQLGKRMITLLQLRR